MVLNILIWEKKEFMSTDYTKFIDYITDFEVENVLHVILSKNKSVTSILCDLLVDIQYKDTHFRTIPLIHGDYGKVSFGYEIDYLLSNLLTEITNAFDQFCYDQLEIVLAYCYPEYSAGIQIENFCSTLCSNEVFILMFSTENDSKISGLKQVYSIIAGKDKTNITDFIDQYLENYNRWDFLHMNGFEEISYVKIYSSDDNKNHYLYNY